ncbi:hypothetical protein [Nocardiopsis sp. CNT-189]|uniref:hypothetical protein n=1 Tax=Nocardiopsis oceanisediminis TaxID=2816862 RepID=UPI003B3BC207
MLSAPVSRVALPLHARQSWGNGLLLPALMEPGTYAVDPEPSGPPWRRWDEIGADEAAARGVFAPVHALSFGAPGAIVVAPGDTRGTALIPGRYAGNCCGLDGGDGPNLACERCGREVATCIDDCSYWRAVWFDPEAVRDAADGGPAARATGRAAGRDEAPACERWDVPPVEQTGGWSPEWSAAVGSGLAHLLAASAGAPVAVPGGLFAELFTPALNALLPADEPVRRAVFAGPGLPAPAGASDIPVVPIHSLTGEAWRPPGAERRTVPLPAGMWARLVDPEERLPVPATGGLPAGVLRDDPPPMRPMTLMRPDPQIFLHTLARLPAVRRPRLRGIYDRVRSRPYGHPF